MKPLQISAYRLAKLIGVPTSKIQNILHDRVGITVDTSIRLGRVFGVSNKYFFNLQEDIAFRKQIYQYINWLKSKRSFMT